MASCAANDVARRVVVLAADRACIPAGGAGAPYVCIFVTHPYQAAAEIMAAPVAALVVDLRMLPGRHRRLLQVARQAGVDVLAVGALPPGLRCDELSGTRMVSKDDLPGLLKQAADRLASAPGGPQPLPPSVPVPTEDEDMSFVARQEIKDASIVTAAMPADRRQSTPSGIPVDVELPTVAKSADKNSPAREELESMHPVGLLSDEELAALLENEQ